MQDGASNPSIMKFNSKEIFNVKIITIACFYHIICYNILKIT